MAGAATRLRAPFAVVVLVELVPEAADVVVTCGAVVADDVWPGEPLLQPVSTRLASTTAGIIAPRHRRVMFTGDCVHPGYTRVCQTSRKRRMAMADPKEPITTPTMTTTMSVRMTSPPDMCMAPRMFPVPEPFP